VDENCGCLDGTAKLNAAAEGLPGARENSAVGEVGITFFFSTDRNNGEISMGLFIVDFRSNCPACLNLEYQASKSQKQVRSQVIDHCLKIELYISYIGDHNQSLGVVSL
jgi:hypothetical protein